MIVTDASVIVGLLGGTVSEVRAARRALEADPAWVAPSHWMAETFHALRGLTLGHRLSPERADDAIHALPVLGVVTIATDGLIPHMWRLRHNFTGYDAAYVALAQLHDLTLVTADRGMARVAVEYSRVELVRG